MKVVYPVLFTFLHDEKNTVLIEVPDLEILSEGFGMQDAVAMARDAIELTLVTLEDDKNDIPVASEIQNIDLAKSTFAVEGETIISIIDADSAAYRKRNYTDNVSRSIFLPKWLDFEVQAANINISSVLQEALVNKLGLA